jgi:hypothetical protein
VGLEDRPSGQHPKIAQQGVWACCSSRSTNGSVGGNHKSRVVHTCHILSRIGQVNRTRSRDDFP